MCNHSHNIQANFDFDNIIATGLEKQMTSHGATLVSWLSRMQARMVPVVGEELPVDVEEDNINDPRAQ